MSLVESQLPSNNEFYKNNDHRVIVAMIAAIFVTIVLVFVVMYQAYHRPAPAFEAVMGNQKMALTPQMGPNLLPDTILRWASKAANVAYTLDFANYAQQVQAVRPYFTPDGWVNYQASIQKLIDSVKANQLIVNGVVAGPPVISNEGDLYGKGYVWRVQIPFLVTYLSGSTTVHKNQYVIITIVKVPTNINPQGIGIDQFVMT